MKRTQTKSLQLSLVPNSIPTEPVIYNTVSYFFRLCKYRTSVENNILFSCFDTGTLSVSDGTLRFLLKWNNETLAVTVDVTPTLRVGHFRTETSLCHILQNISHLNPRLKPHHNIARAVNCVSGSLVFQPLCRALSDSTLHSNWFPAELDCCTVEWNLNHQCLQM